MTRYSVSARRRGTTIIEFVVACSLLGSLILCVVPAVVRIGRVQQTIRHDRIAMDEITNRMEHLVQLPLEEIEEEIATLTPSEFALASLPDPQLTGELQESEQGYRLALEISWDSPGRRVAPVTMATWLFSDSVSESPEKEAMP
jgi:hypothetical protein